jgi:hypothetical protein
MEVRPVHCSSVTLLQSNVSGATLLQRAPKSPSRCRPAPATTDGSPRLAEDDRPAPAHG